MDGRVTAIKKQNAANKSGCLYWVFFHMEDGKSARTCVLPDFTNYSRWQPVISRYFAGKEVIVNKLDFVHGYKRLVDANSLIEMKG